MSYYDNDNIDRAVKLYFRQRRGFVHRPAQPLLMRAGRRCDLDSEHQWGVARFKVLPSGTTSHARCCLVVSFVTPRGLPDSGRSRWRPSRVKINPARPRETIAKIHLRDVENLLGNNLAILPRRTDSPGSPFPWADGSGPNLRAIASATSRLQ